MNFCVWQNSGTKKYTFLNNNNMNINKFKPSDRITRSAPGKLGIDRDYTYMGDQLEFLGIANGLIYLKPIDQSLVDLLEMNNITLSLDGYSDGWEFWVESEFLTKKDAVPELSISQIKNQLQEAIICENYEEAGRLKKLLDDQE